MMLKNYVRFVGGIINTNNEKIYNKLSRMRSHGITKNESEFENKENAYSNNGILNPWYYEQIELGFNYKLSDINCALATSQFISSSDNMPLS